MAGEFAQRAAEIGSVALIECRQAFGEGHQPMLAGSRLGVDPEFAGERVQADAVVLAQRDGGERQSDAEPGADARRILEVHAARPVHQQVDRQVLVFLEDAHEQAPQAPVDVPVDGPQVVAGDVGLEVGELQPETPVAGGLLGGPPVPHQAPGMDAERLQRGQELRVEEFGERRGFGHGSVPRRCGPVRRRPRGAG